MKYVLFNLTIVIITLCIVSKESIGQNRIDLCTQWRDFTRATQSSSLAVDGKYVWAGTPGGLVRFNTITKEHELFLKTNTGDVSEGNDLPVNWVTSLVRDRAGAIWAGTWCGGVARYMNGAWTKFNTHNTGLPDSLILSLALDSSGNVWAGTASGLAKFSGGTFTAIPMPNLPKEYRAIYSMAFDPSGNLWVGAQAGNGYAALNKFDGTNWTAFQPQNSLILDQYIFSVAAAPDGTIWIGFEFNEIESFNDADPDPSSAWTVYVAHPGFSGSDNPVYAIAIDDSGAVWVGNWLGAAMLYNGKWKTIASGHTSAIAVDGGTVWFANDPGILRFQNDTTARYDDFSNSTLPANEMGPYITVDHNGNTWASVPQNVNFAVRTDTGWSTITPPATMYEWALASDSSGNIWAGITSSGIAEFDGTNWNSFAAPNSPIISTGVGSMVYDKRRGRVWAGTNKGLTSFDGQNWTAYGLPTGFYGYNGFCAMAIDTAGNIWACSTYGGVLKFDGTNWQVFTTVNSGLPDDFVMSVASQRSGAVWVATNSGLAKYENGVWTVFTSANSPLPIDAVTAVAVDTADRVWAGTFGYGAVCYDHGTWRVYNQDNSGLTNWHIQSIAADSRGNVWFAMEYAGIAEFNSAGFGSIEPLFIHDTVSSCNGAALKTIVLTGDGCAGRRIVQQRITGIDSASYQIEHVATTGDITMDSIVVAFAPDTARSYNATLLITLEDGTALNVPLAGYGIPSMSMSISTADAFNDTIGAEIDVPIVISNSSAIHSAEVTVHYDTSMLVYRGSVSASGNGIDEPGMRSPGQSRLLIPTIASGDTIAYAHFDFFPSGHTCTDVTFDSLTITSRGALCAALRNTSAACHICSSNGCGNGLISQFLRYGTLATLTVQPNPAGAQMTLHTSATLGPAKIEIVDPLGISRQSLFGVLDSDKPFNLDLQSISDGLYYLKITASSTMGSGQFTRVIPFIHYAH
jgi:ligand-binding sensor domain-containing protein